MSTARAFATAGVAVIGAFVLVACVRSCNTSAPVTLAQPAAVQYVDQPPAQQPVQVVQQPVYVQPQASTHDGLVEGMILGHMMSGGGGYGRGTTIVNHTTVNKTVVRPTPRAPTRSFGGRRR